jgi:hypothetical protein
VTARGEVSLYLYELMRIALSLIISYIFRVIETLILKGVK